MTEPDDDAAVGTRGVGTTRRTTPRPAADEAPRSAGALVEPDALELPGTLVPGPRAPVEQPATPADDAAAAETADRLSRPLPPPSTRRPSRAVLAALSVLALGALVGAVVVTVRTGPDTPPVVAAAPVVATKAETALPAPVPVPPRPLVALRSVAVWTGTASYSLGAGASAVTLTVTRAGTSSRVDVAAPGGTSSLITTPDASVACQLAATTVCVQVAGAGAPVPAAFDPGVARLLAALPGLADAAGLEDLTWLPRSAVTQSAACVATTGVDPSVLPADLSGTYCVTERGLLRQATTPSGLLSLVSTSSTVDPAAFTPPVLPVPLP